MSSSRQLTVEQAISRAKKASKKGNTSLALQLYNAVLQRQPNHPVAKKGLRNLQKKLRQGQSTPTQSIEPSPDKIDALVSLCHAGQMERAEQVCRELLEAYPQSLVVINVLGVALQRQGKLEESVQALDEAIRLKPDFVEAYSNRGIALKELGQLAKAVASYDEAIRLKPNYAEAYFNRGNAQKDLGQMEEAVASYDKAIEIVPGFAQAHRSLSALKTYTSEDPQIGLMESLLINPEMPESNRIEICFALAKAYEDLGEDDRSFGYLEEGNRLRKKELHYNIEVDRKLFAEIRGVFKAACPTPGIASYEKAPIRPLFIVGMMRSGTSLVEQILASHSEVHGAGELETMNRLLISILSDLPDESTRQGERQITTSELQALRSDYLEALTELQVHEKIITDKMPLNFRWIGFILSAFPEAKIIHLVRDPRATCWSIYKHYFPDEGNGYAYHLGDLAEFYNLYVDLVSFWRDRYPDSIYDLCYEDLTENQEEEIRKLLAFCDLQWEERCLDFHETKRAVKTSSAAQVRRTMYKGSSEAWKRYERHLQSLIKNLGY